MKKLNLTREKVLIFITSALVAFLISNNVWHLQDFLNYSGPILLWTSLFIIVCFLIVLAGLVVIKSLFKVGAGLSLIIFLAQSYCSPGVVQTTSGKQALAGLIFLGLSYIIYDFLTSVSSELKTQFENLKKVEGKWEWKGVIMSLFLILFVVLFVVTIYEVMSPIVLSLCPYK